MSDNLLEFLDEQISDLTDIPKKPKKESSSDLNFLFELIDQQVGKLNLLAEEKKCDISNLSDKMIPKIHIAEIPWADMSTEGGERADPNRAELETYLSKLATHRDLPSKFKAIQEMLDGNLEKVGIKKDDVKSLSTILSYVVFVKTLTSIIQDFNPASAGFLFEGLLGVTTKGKQIPAKGAGKSAGGGDTIGDMESKMPGYKRVSLKLLTEKGDSAGSDIDGSFTDLVGDMQNPASDYRMPYLIALKSLTGKGKDTEGTITVWEFVFDIDTFLHWMSTSTDSRKCITLASPEPLPPRRVKGEFGEIEIVKGETSREILDGEAVYNIKINLNDWLATEAPKDLSNEEVYEQALIQAIGMWSSAQQPKDPSPEESGKAYDYFSNPLNYIEMPEEVGIGSPRVPVYKMLKKQWSIHNQTSEKGPTKKNPKGSEYYLPSGKQEYTERLKLIKWMTPDDSIKELARLQSDPGAFWSTIEKYSKGFQLPGVSQWKISQTNIIDGKEPYVKQLGQLKVGQKQVLKTLTDAIDKSNQKMFEIYCELDDLGVNLREFFMKGFQVDVGNAAISNAGKIARRTKSFMGDSESE